MGVLLVLLFLIVPIVEIYVIIQVGQAIGAVPTLLLLIVESIIGAWLVKREGGRAWSALKQAVGTGRLPTGELADAGLILVGGTLLLTPGFVSDIFGLFLIMPLTRSLARRALGWYVARKATVIAYQATGGSGGGTAYVPGDHPSAARDGRSRPPGGRVVPGEVVRDGDAPGPTGPPGAAPGGPDAEPGRAEGG